MVTAQRFIDRIFGSILVVLVFALSRLFAWIHGKKAKSQTPTIAVIKLWAVGDSVVLLPTIKALRERYPGAKIDVFARKRNAAVFECTDYINRIILFEPENIFKIISSFRRYDYSIDSEPYLNISALLSFWLATDRIGFDHSTRALLYTKKIKFSRKHLVMQSYLEMAAILGGKYTKDTLVRLKTGKAEISSIDQFLKRNKTTPKLIGICIGVAESVKSREWPSENFAALADKIIEKYHQKIVFIGSNNEKEMIAQVLNQMKHRDWTIDSSGQTNLKEMFELVSRCHLFVSNDTGPMHVAAAQGCRTIGLFGPNTPALWAPFGKNNISIYKKISCSPCIRNEYGIMPECKYGKNNSCMKAITVNDVMAAVTKLSQSK